jgi:carbon monoxide dehydrogenase subunit G
MILEGAFTVAASPDRVWRVLLDPAIVAPCVPGCDAVEVVSDREYRTRVTVTLGPIKTSFALVVMVTEIDAGRYVATRTTGDEGSRASLLTANSRVALRALDDGGTEVAYRSEVSLSGRLGKFGLGVMKKRAEELAHQFADNLRAKLAEAPA